MTFREGRGLNGRFCGAPAARARPACTACISPRMRPVRRSRKGGPFRLESRGFGSSGRPDCLIGMNNPPFLCRWALPRLNARDAPRHRADRRRCGRFEFDYFTRSFDAAIAGRGAADPRSESTGKPRRTVRPDVWTVASERTNRSPELDSARRAPRAVVGRDIERLRLAVFGHARRRPSVSIRSPRIGGAPARRTDGRPKDAAAAEHHRPPSGPLQVIRSGCNEPRRDARAPDVHLVRTTGPIGAVGGGRGASARPESPGFGTEEASFDSEAGRSPCPDAWTRGHAGGATGSSGREPRSFPAGASDPVGGFRPVPRAHRIRLDDRSGVADTRGPFVQERSCPWGSRVQRQAGRR